jgi:hypothetical protein
MIDRTTAGTLNIGSEDLAKWDCLGTFSGPARISEAVIFVGIAASPDARVPV